MSSHRTQILLRKAAAQIVFHEFAPESPNVLITFGALGDGMAEWGFGTDFARKCGVNNVFVSKKRRPIIRISRDANFWRRFGLSARGTL